MKSLFHLGLVGILLVGCDDSSSDAPTPPAVQVGTPSIFPDGGVFGEPHSVDLVASIGQESVEYSLDSGKTWLSYSGAITLSRTQLLYYRGVLSTARGAIKTALFVFPAYGQTVAHGNVIYKTVVIGKQTWFASNLDYSVSAGVTIGACYENNSDYCAKFGRLYTWAEAVALHQGCNMRDSTYTACTLTEPVQGICPTGWHVPSSKDWEDLKAITSIAPNVRSQDEWLPSAYEVGGPGIDLFGFRALPAGVMINDIWSHLGGAAYFWSSKELSGREAPVAVLTNTSDVFNEKSKYGKSIRASVRCIKND